MFDTADLMEKRDWLEALSSYIEWEYSLEYAQPINDVIELLEKMIDEE